MNKQRTFVAVVVVVAMVTAVGFLVTTTPFSSFSFFSSSYIPVRSLSLQQVRNIEVLTLDSPNEAPGFIDSPPANPPPSNPLPANPPPNNLLPANPPPSNLPPNNPPSVAPLPANPPPNNPPPNNLPSVAPLPANPPPNNPPPNNPPSVAPLPANPPPNNPPPNNPLPANPPPNNPPSVAPLPANPPPNNPPPQTPPETPPPKTPPDQPLKEEDKRISPPSKKPTQPPLTPAPPTPAAPADPYEKNENPTLPYLNPVLEQLEGTPGGIWNDVPVNTTDENGKKLKILLFWNDSYGNKNFGLGYGREPFIRAGCRVNTCLATGDRERYPLSEVDAIMWHLRSKDRSLPKKRYPHTRYIFWMMESASYPFANMRTYRNVFNWTFTYRRDSDFYNPYQRVFRRRKSLPPPATPINYAKGKTKLAAWFVSNCNTKSGREHMVDELKKLMKVDVYGHCGTLDCPRSNHGHCMALLDADYKFYLSFENSLCRDYVTEKFFGALSVNVVPVVWGLGNYSAIAPRHSFIDALAFPSARALADYLLYLNTNDTAYNQYFRWKRHYHQTHDWAKKSIAFCDICERLHSNEPPKTYDLQKWFIKDSHCLGYYDTRIQKYIHNKR